MKKLLIFIVLANLSNCTNPEDDLVVYKSFINYKPVNGAVTEVKELYSNVDDNGKLKKPSWEMVYSLDKYHRITESYMRNLTVTPHDTSGHRKTYFNKENRIDSVVFDTGGYYRTVMKASYPENNSAKTEMINREGKVEHKTHTEYDKTGRPLKSNTTWYTRAGEVLKETIDEFIYEDNLDEPVSHTTSSYDANKQLTKKEKRVFTYGAHQEIITTKVYNEKDSLVQTLQFEQELDDQHNLTKTTTYVNGELNTVVEREFTYEK